MNRLEDSEFIEEICSRLDASIEELNHSISQQLDQSRTAAMQAINDGADALTLQVSKQLANEDLPPAIEARLNQIRQQAIAKLESAEAANKQGLYAQFRDWLGALLGNSNLAIPGSVFASACVLVTVVSIFYTSSRPFGPLILEDEIVLIASADDFELYENLEFYQWLSDNELAN